MLDFFDYRTIVFYVLAFSCHSTRGRQQVYLATKDGGVGGVSGSKSVFARLGWVCGGGVCGLQAGKFGDL